MSRRFGPGRSRPGRVLEKARNEGRNIVFVDESGFYLTPGGREHLCPRRPDVGHHQLLHPRSPGGNQCGDPDGRPALVHSDDCGILSTARSTDKARIPDQLIAEAVTFARLGVGAIAAIAVYMFLVSGLLSGIMTPSSVSPSTVLAVAFASGFSDGLVTRAVESVTKSTK